MAYVYRHIRLDKNEPFYIGFSVNKYRPNIKSGGGRSRNPLWSSIAAKTKYDVEILFSDLSIDDALKKEIELIKLYGRINMGTGALANLTDGGEGVVNICPEKRKKIAASWERKKLDLVGLKFKYVEVLEYKGTKNGHTIFLCKCVCGNEVILKGKGIKSYHLSCGCKHRAKRTTEIHRRMQPIWGGLMRRCYNKNYSSYKDFGGRGVICLRKMENIRRVCI